MNQRLIIIVISLISTMASAQIAEREIYARVEAMDSRIEVESKISLPPDMLEKNRTVYFELNSKLNIEKVEGGKITAVESSNDYVKRYKLTLKKSANYTFSIKYAGIIQEEIKQTAAEYARGFSETKGTISENGIYLAGSTYWIPTFGKKLLSSFVLDVTIDEGWSVVSQGERSMNEVIDNYKHIVYNSPQPMDEIYLIGAKWTEYSKALGDVEVQAFLRTPDQELADRYLNVTSGYLRMYESLIGDYPYTKFALVENFWETGYGMPSFTLLGEKVIRFPWILYSSYPHELLHNYWGNGVFVDYDQGNWCEGITAYMADHLLQEQQGNGATYRRTTLQKFTDYVNPENDFPVSEFLNRNNSAEEAIGYGKVLMINHMLRTYLGDDVFKKAYQKFYNDYKFRKVSYPEIQKSFEEVSGKDLSEFFNQWVNRKGAPSFELKDVTTDGNKLTFTLKQVQKEEVFMVKVPVAIYTQDSDKVVWKYVNMKDKEQTYTVDLNQKPLKIEIDPQFNLMRWLDRKEVPAALSQVFGNKKMAMILPAMSKYLESYKQMAKTWKATQEAQGKKAEILLDTDLKSIPADKSVWIFGFENTFNTNELQTAYASSFDSETFDKINKLAVSGALVYAIPNSVNIEQTVGFVGAHSNDAISALTRKLLHYGKYGYLGFEGDGADNILKGSLPALESPLSVTMSKGEIKAKISPQKGIISICQKKTVKTI